MSDNFGVRIVKEGLNAFGDRVSKTYIIKDEKEVLLKNE